MATAGTRSWASGSRLSTGTSSGITAGTPTGTGFDWDYVERVVEDIDYSGVFEEWDEEWEVELACSLE
ncbi:MAG: hypothetical protein M3P92_04640 [Actinomycetota bacterium]|nr:hypothetical protein [Actinomycetota bacterium]